MKLMIKKSDLLNIPYSEYDDLPDNEFDAIKEIKNRGNHVEHVGWLIVNCKLAQTAEMLTYFKSLTPSAYDVCLVILFCKFAQITEMLEYFKSLNPLKKDVSLLITSCKFTQTAEMLEYFKSLKPSKKDVSWLIENCKFASRYGIT